MRREEAAMAGNHALESESHIERFQHDVERLEKRSGWKWVAILLLAGGAAVGAYHLSSSSKPVAPRVSAKGVLLIEVLEPAQGRLGAAPASFRWESVAGRNDYMFHLFEQGNPMALVERPTRENKTQLTVEEQSKLVAGKSYVWRVDARGQDGTVIGSGRGLFDL
jgi:hypothetical protein